MHWYVTTRRFELSVSVFMLSGSSSSLRPHYLRVSTLTKVLKSFMRGIVAEALCLC